MPDSNLASGLACVQAVCRRGFPAPDLPPEVLHAVGQVIPYDAACWGIVDQDTLWPVTNASTFPSRDHMAAVWEYEITVPDPLKITELMSSSERAGALSAATGGEPSRAARYRAIFSRLDITDELRAALTAQGSAWGYLLLLRKSGRFSSAETALLSRAAQIIGTALRDAVLDAYTGTDDDPATPAVLILDPSDRCLGLTEQAREYLGLLAPGKPPRLPEAINVVAAQARARTAGRTDRTARGVVPVRVGPWLICTGATLDDTGSVAITVSPARPADAAPLVLRAHGLTGRECQVALAALRGQPTQAIARDLFLSPWTVQDHLKAIFRKIGVRSRMELRLQLLSPPRDRPGDT